MNYLKKNIIFILISLAATVNTFGQQHEQCKHHREQIKAERVAFITDALNLTVKEAQQFWPIYNDYTKKIESLREKKYSDISLLEEGKTYTEKDYQQILDKRISFIKQEAQLKIEYQEGLSKIFTAKKTFLLYKAERDFKRKLIKDFRGKKPACIKE